MSSNLPDGVTDAHPHFNPPAERASAVECGNDLVDVVPAYVVTTALQEIAALLERIPSTATGAYAPSPTVARKKALERVLDLQRQLDDMEQEVEYECPFNDEVDLEESECARWICPVCGNERETDNAPEERDPDEDYERMGEGR